MASIYDNIRAALESHLSTNVGSTPIAWENVVFTRTTGQSFVQPILIPTVREPAARGLNPTIYYRGVFRVNCYTPQDSGPSAGDSLANTIIEAFEATSTVSLAGTDVSIMYAERGAAMVDGTFYVVPVDIGWYIYS